MPPLEGKLVQTVNDNMAAAANSILVVVQIGDNIQVDPYPGNYKFFTKDGNWVKITDETGELVALYNQSHIIACRILTAEQMLHARLLQASGTRSGADPLATDVNRGSAG